MNALAYGSTPAAGAIHFRLALRALASPFGFAINSRAQAPRNGAPKPARYLNKDGHPDTLLALDRHTDRRASQWHADTRTRVNDQMQRVTATWAQGQTSTASGENGQRNFRVRFADTSNTLLPLVRVKCRDALNRNRNALTPKTPKRAPIPF